MGLVDMISQSSMTTDNLNKTNLYDKSSLILAISYGHCHIVTLLLEKGADVDLVTEYGDWSFEGAIALQTPCEASFEAIGGLLLDRGANINAQAGLYGTALQAACCNINQVIVRLLLDRGANINARGGEYGNALQAACYSGNEVIVRLLLDRGANINVRGGHYFNVLQAIRCEYYKVIVQLLLYRGAKLTPRKK